MPRGTLTIALVFLAAAIVAFAPAAAPDRKPPRVVVATVVDADGDSRADRLRLTYSERVRHRADGDGGGGGAGGPSVGLFKVGTSAASVDGGSTVTAGKPGAGGTGGRSGPGGTGGTGFPGIAETVHP